MKKVSADYLKKIEERGKKTKVYKSFQMTGLALSRILDDEEHKALYIKLAKEMDQGALLRLAKDVAEKRRVKNLGAYFMRMLQKEQDKIKIEKKRREQKANPKSPTFVKISKLIYDDFNDTKQK